MGLAAIDSRIKPLDVMIPMFQTEYEVKTTNTPHQLINFMPFRTSRCKIKVSKIITSKFSPYLKHVIPIKAYTWSHVSYKMPLVLL